VQATVVIGVTVKSVLARLNDVCLTGELVEGNLSIQNSAQVETQIVADLGVIGRSAIGAVRVGLGDGCLHSKLQFETTL